MNNAILALSLALSLAPSVHAQTAATSPLKDLSVSGVMDYESQYVFRGKKITNSAFQPSINLGYPVYGGTINTYMWTNQPIGSRGTAGASQTNEIDSGLFYTYPLKQLVDGLTVDVGYQYYWYPDTTIAPPNPFTTIDRSNEIHVGFNFDDLSVLSGLSQSYYYYHDFNLDSEVVELGFSYTRDLSSLVGLSGLSLTVAVTMGYSHENRTYGDHLPTGVANERNAYVYYKLAPELDYKINQFTTAFVGFRCSGNDDGTQTNPFTWDPQEGGTKNNIWAGAGIRFGK